MARGGGGRGRKVVVNSGKWHTVSKSTSKANTQDSDDEEIATKMTNEDWSQLFEWFAEVQSLCVKRVHNSILEEVMTTYCPETSDSYEKILEETHEWIKRHR